jgi:hypothetical protein
MGSVIAPHSSTLSVKIDGEIIETVVETDVNESAYTAHALNVSQFANGGAHTLTFEYNRPAGIASDNFTIDDVTLGDVALLQLGPASAAGRVTTTTGIGIRGARVTATAANGLRVSALTNAFGYYIVPELTAGNAYVFSVSAKGISFTNAVVGVDSSAQTINFSPN